MNEHAEIWKDISGYEGVYQISNIGRVRKTKNRKDGLPGNQFLYMAKTDNGNGYDYITLHKNGTRKNHYIHRLVASAFIENPQKKNCVNHIDYNRKNNNVDNLEWCTCKENIRHSAIHMSGPRQQTNNTGEKYIHKRRYGGFEVVVNRRYLGKYADIKEAIRERDLYIEKIKYY